MHVATSPLTGRVYCGSVLKGGNTWAANKTDVTGEACAAVAQHVLMAGGKTTVTRNGLPAFELVVREIAPRNEDDAQPCRDCADLAVAGVCPNSGRRCGA